MGARLLLLVCIVAISSLVYEPAAACHPEQIDGGGPSGPGHHGCDGPKGNPPPDPDEGPATRTDTALERAGLTRIRTLAPSVHLDIRYATRRNFTGRPLDGYCRPPYAYLLRPAARSLGAVQRDLRERGLGLKVFDAYRPARASRAMMRWARRTGNEHLLNGYIAERSRHNEGGAVDLTLVRLASGREVNMGTAYDTFSSRAATENAHGSVLHNRRLLVRSMAARGFVNYSREWWHYEHGRPARRLDVPLGC